MYQIKTFILLVHYEFNICSFVFTQVTLYFLTTLNRKWSFEWDMHEIAHCSHEIHFKIVYVIYMFITQHIEMDFFY